MLITNKNIANQNLGLDWLDEHCALPWRSSGNWLCDVIYVTANSLLIVYRIHRKVDIQCSLWCSFRILSALYSFCAWRSRGNWIAPCKVVVLSIDMVGHRASECCAGMVFNKAPHSQQERPCSAVSQTQTLSTHTLINVPCSGTRDAVCSPISNSSSCASFWSTWWRVKNQKNTGVKMCSPSKII